MRPIGGFLDRQLAPGSNRRGQVSGAAWSYLLPSRDLADVLCLGEPAPDAVDQLARLSESVEIVPASQPRGAWSAQIAARAWPNVTVHTGRPARVDGSYDLAWIVERSARDVGRAVNARLLYEEARRLSPPAANGSLLVRLTPLLGEARSAVPADDDLTSEYFHRHNLDDQWLRRELGRRGVPHGAAIARAAAARLPRLVHRFGRLSGAGVTGVAPRYLVEIARGGGVDIGNHRWGLSAKGQYASQKTLFLLFPDGDRQPDTVVKISQGTDVSYLLDNARRGLETLAQTSFGRAGRAPGVRFAGAVRGQSVLAEQAITGLGFERHAPADAGDRRAADAVDAIIELGQAGLTRSPAAAVLESLRLLLARFVDHYQLPNGGVGFLAGQFDVLATGEGWLPLVIAHGDVATHNLVVRADERVVLLDWENFEPLGLPAWDLFHFLRSFVTWASRRRSVHSRLAILRRHFLEGSPLTSWMTDSVGRYCRDIGLDQAHVAPLFWLYLVSQAVREVPRLHPARLAQGHELKVLNLMLDGAQRPALRRILQLDGA